MLSHFNIRVYGIWIRDSAVLLSEEMIREQRIVKFPGGGLELGEGTIDGLKREWKEELDVDIEVLEHFYTTDYFQKSAFDSSQVISIYYLVEAAALNSIKNMNSYERHFWQPLSELHAESFTLPIDRVVGRMLVATT